MKKQLLLLLLIAQSICYANNFFNCLPPTAAISYTSPICANSTLEYVTITGTTGGAFSASPSGLTIDSSSGNIQPNLSTPGNYTVTYYIAASGPDPAYSTTTQVMIYPIPNAGTDGAVTVCDSSTATIDLFSLIAGEQPGGIWTSDPGGTGGAFNAAAGTFTPVSGATSRTFTYTITTPCGSDTSVATIAINVQPTATISGSATICGGSSIPVTISGTPNATVAYTYNGGPSQTITLNSSGIATLNYNFYATTTLCLQWVASAGSACITNLSSCCTISVSSNAYAGTDGQVNICEGDSSAINLSNILNGEQSGGTWVRSAGTGGTFDAFTGVFVPGQGMTTSIFTYSVTATAPCNVNDTSTVTVNVVPELTFTASFPDITTCNFFELPPLDIGNYYTEANGGGNLIPAGTLLYSSQIVYVFVQSGTCVAEQSFFVEIIPPTYPNFAPIADICAGSTPTVLPTISPEGISGTWSPATIDTSIIGTSVFVFIPDGSQCAQAVSLLVNVIPCGGITLNSYLDLNTNGVEDIGEPKLPIGHFDYEINGDGIIHHINASGGVCNIFDGNSANTYDVTFIIDTPYNTSYNVTIPSYSNVSTSVPSSVYNFPVTVSQSYSDLKVTLVPNNNPRPGFTYQNTITYTNYGNTITNGSISFTKDSAVSIASTSELSAVIIPTGFTFDFVNLVPFESRSISVIMQVPPIPTVSIGQLLTDSVTIGNPDISDTGSLTQPVIGSYDPNDKVESHGKDIVFSTFTSDDYLYYTIRFENTGNANATDIRVTDVLNAQLDETSVKAIGSSHNYTMERTGNNLEFRFDDIQLPPSVTETNIGKGYMMFKVKPKPGYAIGDIIPNSASIYFDTNPAIVTNTFNTEFVSQLATSEFENGAFSVYPNPASDKITITANKENGISNITIYDVLGKTMLSQNGRGASETVNIQSLENGMYFLEITAADRSKTVRKLLVK